MPGNRPNFLDQLLEIWSRLLWWQRLSILASGFLSLVLIGSFVYFMNHGEYQVLYRDLNPEDARAIAARLKEEKRDFLEQGTSILVAASKNEIDKLHFEIYGSGLARSSCIGFEIFDMKPDRQANLQQALECELERTISSLSEIFCARVYIRRSKDSHLNGKEAEARATVLITLREGAELSESRLAGLRV